MFGVMFLMFFVVFFLALGIIVFTLVRGVAQWKHNNESPRLSIEATVVAKRTRVSTHHHNDMPTRSTTYYATFQVASGDRMELVIPSAQIGYLVEGDRGTLSFQGTRFLGFERHGSAG